MRTWKKILLALSFGLGTAGVATGVEYVYPVQQFDLAEAKAHLEPGTATLRGKLTFSSGAANQVAIYPCIGYFQEFLELRRQLETVPGKSTLLDDRASRCRLVVDSHNGDFEFRNLKPGKYYVESPPVYNRGDSPEIDKIFDGGGCVRFQASVGKVVEVTEDGQMVETSL